MNRNHYTSLELSKMLKEAGAPQVSEWYWNYHIPTDKWILTKKLWRKSSYPQMSAFSVAELGEMLPQDIWIDKKRYEIDYQKWSDGDWCVNYRYGRFTVNDYLIEDSQYSYEHRLMPLEHNEAEARGKMYLYLLQNKLIEGGKYEIL